MKLNTKNNPECQVLIQGEICEAFKVGIDLLQRNGMSLMLFDLASEQVIRTSHKYGTIMNPWICK